MTCTSFEVSKSPETYRSIKVALKLSGFRCYGE